MALAVALVVVLLGAARADAKTRTYVIAIGHNEPPAESGGENLRPLRYADDDAADFYSFISSFSERASLLAVLDADTQRRFPGLAERARPPSLAELRRVVADYKQRFEADRSQGHEPVLVFFYSGHGSRGGGQAPSLTLLGGALTQAVLYDEVLAPLPARYVHLLVDACHAEAIVRPRGSQAETVDLSDDDVRTYAAQHTLARFPHVGAVIATASAAQAHEWDVYQRGVFTHEVLSGLRGAADVNGDGRIEYSELYAFLAAANREVSDPRGRLAVVVRPPAVNRRAWLVDLSTAPTAARLTGDAHQLGRFHLEDRLGNRLADVRSERGYKLALVVPANETLYLRTTHGETEVRVRAGKTLALAGLKLRPAATAARGALAESLRQGLFATPFGPTYYRGFVDRHGEFLAVTFVADEEAATVAVAPAPDRPLVVSRRPAWAAFGVAGLALTSATLLTLTLIAQHDYDTTRLERPAADAKSRFEAYRAATIGAAAGAAIAGGIGGWLLYRAVRAAGIPATGATLTPSPNSTTLGLTFSF